MTLLEALAAAPHGADVYDPAGRPLDGLDFSSTVVTLGPPEGWQERAAGALESLTRYPQPHGRGLDQAIEAALGLAPGGVLVSNGASEALEWAARLARGAEARLATPCFGEYRAKLERAGARVSEAWLGAAQPLEPAELLRGLGPGDQLWLANPSNPFGRVESAAAVARLAEAARECGVLLVLDEALLAQRLDCLVPPRPQPGALVIRSLGKGLGLPGLRLGFAAAEPGLIQRLRRFQDPWNVNSLAQALGSWALREELQGWEARRLALWRRSRNLLVALSSVDLSLDNVAPCATGYFCLDLGRATASATAATLSDQGLFVRDCSSYGAWGRAWLRLNPRADADNLRLARAMGRLLPTVA